MSAEKLPPRFFPLRTLGLATAITLGVTAALKIGGNVGHEFGQAMMEGDLKNLGALLSIIGNLGIILAIPLSLLSVGLGITWLRRAVRNLETLNVEGVKSKDWYAFSILVPLLNLVLPMMALQETYKASNPDDLDPRTWQQGKGSPEVMALWVSCVGAAVLDLVLVLMIFGIIPTATAEVVTNVDSVLHISTVICAISAIRAISTRQAKKRELLVSNA